MDLDKAVRVLVILALIAGVLFRMFRYFRYGLSKRVISLPSSSGVMPPSPTAVQANSQLPTPPESSKRPGRWRSGLIAAGVWVCTNIILWYLLFGLRALADVPVIWRLFAGVFANFYLFPLARRLGEKAARRAPENPAPGGSPFTD